MDLEPVLSLILLSKQKKLSPLSCNSSFLPSILQGNRGIQFTSSRLQSIKYIKLSELTPYHPIILVSESTSFWTTIESILHQASNPLDASRSQPYSMTIDALCLLSPPNTMSPNIKPTSSRSHPQVLNVPLLKCPPSSSKASKLILGPQALSTN